MQKRIRLYFGHKLLIGLKLCKVTEEDICLRNSHVLLGNISSIQRPRRSGDCIFISCTMTYFGQWAIRIVGLRPNSVQHRNFC